MVKPQFSNIDVQIWLHRARLGKTKRAICIFHSSCDQGAAILDALRELEEDGVPARRTLTFNTQGQSKFATQMQLTLEHATERLRVMNIAFENTKVTIHLTPIGLNILRDGLAAWLRGAEDFGISAHHANLGKKELEVLDLESLELWFWGPGYAGP